MKKNCLLIIIFGFLISCSENKKESAVFSIVIHGGAGTMDREKMSVEKEIEYKKVLEEALNKAFELGVDLVEVSPNANPPVCKIIDYGKLKYQLQKKQAEAKKKQKTFEVKEVKIRPGIEEHDYGVKLKSIQRFLNDGDKVKITLRFRGREMIYHQKGMEVLKKLESAVKSLAKIEQLPKLEGRQMTMVVAPR